MSTFGLFKDSFSPKNIKTMPPNTIAIRTTKPATNFRIFLYLVIVDLFNILESSKTISSTSFSSNKSSSIELIWDTWFCSLIEAISSFWVTNSDRWDSRNNSSSERSVNDSFSDVSTWTSSRTVFNSSLEATWIAVSKTIASFWLSSLKIESLLFVSEITPFDITTLFCDWSNSISPVAFFCNDPKFSKT